MSAIAWLILIPAAIIGPFPATLQAETAGTATVIDGDTIEVYGQRILLHGIDAPENRQLCRLDGRT